MAEKIIFTMGEVAEMFDVKPSLLRHWESQFPALRPKRNKKGNRLFTQQDIEQLRLIYHLVKERGMTLEGAKKALRSKKATPELSRDAELAERLQRIRAMLLEVREELKMDGEVFEDEEAALAAEEESLSAEAPQTAADEEHNMENVADEYVEEPSPEEFLAAADPLAVESAFEPVVERMAEPQTAESECAEPEPAVEYEPDDSEGGKDGASEDGEHRLFDTEPAEIGEVTTAENAASVVEDAPKRRRRRKKDGEDRELFPFYDQLLF